MHVAKEEEELREVYPLLLSFLASLEDFDRLEGDKALISKTGITFDILDSVPKDDYPCRPFNW